MFVPLSNGEEMMVSATSWFRYLELGFPAQLSHDSSGNGHGYPRAMICDPSPKSKRSCTTTVARILLALRLVEHERTTGEPAPAKGWVTRHKNGDTLDCREGNLVDVPAAGRRNTIRAVWNVRERMKLVALGLNPNGVFAERRRAFREERRREKAAGVGNLRPDISRAIRTRVVDAFPPVDSPEGRGGVGPGGGARFPASVSTANGGAH